MNCTVESKEIQAIESCNIVQQTSFWAKVKDIQGANPMAFDYTATDDLLNPEADQLHKTRGDILVLLRNIDKEHSFAYVPYGPVDEPVFENHGVFLEELSEVLKPSLPEDCILIRYDLPWENQWAKEEDLYDENGNWIGPPDTGSQEFRVNFNTHNWNLVKTQSDILPTNTIFLNLQREPDELMQRMKPKTRYNIRLAHRKGVRVRSYGMDYLDKWYALYKETALRNGVTLHNKEFFTSVLLSQKAKHTGSVDVKLLIADHEGEYLAAMFLILSKNRGTYLYGASSGRKRNFMATYALQWEAINLSREHGCLEYDMFGIAPNANPSHPMHGLYRFKSGFGGSMFHRMGCWDYPLHEDLYKVFLAREANIQGYYNNH